MMADKPRLFPISCGDYVFFGTGTVHTPNAKYPQPILRHQNHWQWGSAAPTIIEAYNDVDDGGKVKDKSDNRVLVGGEAAVDEWFILDVTEDHYQDNPQNATYIKKAMDHEKNRGWFIRLEEMDGSQVGEKLVSSPIIYAGVIYFTTYIPDDDADYNVDDPCAAPGAGGSGYLYEIGYKYGEAVVNHSLSNDSEDGTVVLGRADRRVKLKNKGIRRNGAGCPRRESEPYYWFEIFRTKYTAVSKGPSGGR